MFLAAAGEVFLAAVGSVFLVAAGGPFLGCLVYPASPNAQIVSPLVLQAAYVVALPLVQVLALGVPALNCVDCGLVYPAS